MTTVVCFRCGGEGEFPGNKGRCIPCLGSGELSLERVNYLLDEYWPAQSEGKRDKWQIKKLEAVRRELLGQSQSQQEESTQPPETAKALLSAVAKRLEDRCASPENIRVTRQFLAASAGDIRKALLMM